MKGLSYEQMVAGATHMTVEEARALKARWLERYPEYAALLAREAIPQDRRERDDAPKQGEK